jgi:hypothetical protein
MLANKYFVLFIAMLLAASLLSCQQGTEPKQEKIMEWLDIAANQEKLKGKKVVLVSGDEEYRSEEALPQLAKILAAHHGFDCKVLFAQNPAAPGIIAPNYQHNIPGLEMLKEADLMILFTRFRALPDSQMLHFYNFLLAGKPLIAIRTATHAFDFKKEHPWAYWGNYYEGEKTDWKGGFGMKILGSNWVDHHGKHKYQSARGIFAPEAASHPLTQGISSGAIWGPSDVYEVPYPLSEDAQPIILGQVIDGEGAYDEKDLFFGMKSTDQKLATSKQKGDKTINPNDPLMPIIWTKPYQLSHGYKGQSVSSTIGASTDMLNEDLRRIWVNAVYYLLELPVPEAAEVSIVGEYYPSQFSFHDDAYWIGKNLRISDLAN